MKDDLISVIVPVYNIEDFIEKCVESIINQTYKNLEIILINDGSKDKSGQICNQLKEKYKNIKVIHKNNEGLSEARNDGIKSAKGKYISFIDGDDYIKSNMYELLYNALKENDCDIAECGFIKKMPDSTEIIINNCKENQILPGEDAMKSSINNSIFSTVAWNKLYKKSIFEEHNIFYPKSKLHEDQFTTYKIFEKSKKSIKIKESLYYYVQRDNSIMKTFNIKRLDGCEAIKETMAFIENKYKYMLPEVIDIYYKILIENLQMLYENKQSIPEYKKYAKLIRKDLQIYKQYITNKKIINKLVVINLSLNLFYIINRSKKIIYKCLK